MPFITQPTNKKRKKAMKQITSVFTFVTILIMSFVASAAEKPVWKKQDNFSVIYTERYTTQLNDIYCSASINKEGDLVIFASDANFYGNTASQYLRIKEGIVVEDRTSVTNYKGNFGSAVEGGYSVFVVNIAPHAHTLPAHIRKKFMGTCGID